MNLSTERLYVRTVLLVEDEPTLVETLTYRLEQEGLRVVTAGDGVSALRQVEVHSPDLILLDLMLPEMDGREVCRELRARRYHKPILMLTARGEEMDKVIGLEVGADDYITKPFGTSELIARVRAHLRRFERLVGEEASSVLSAGGVTLDRERREVRSGGEIVSLTPGEFELLSYLMTHPNQTLSRRELLEKVWGYPCGGDPSIVNVAVQRLREKLKPAGPISTIRGVGYLFEAE